MSEECGLGKKRLPAKESYRLLLLFGHDVH